MSDVTITIKDGIVTIRVPEGSVRVEHVAEQLPLVESVPPEVVRGEDEPTEKQEWFLKMHNAWEEGISKHEAFERIQAIKFPQPIMQTLHTHIEETGEPVPWEQPEKKKRGRPRKNTQ